MYCLSEMCDSSEIWHAYLPTLQFIKYICPISKTVTIFYKFFFLFFTMCHKTAATTVNNADPN